MKPTHALLALLPLISPLTAAEDLCAQPSPKEMADELGIKLPRSPWHVANIFWTLEEDVKNFESFSQTITVDRDVPDTYNLYISPVGNSKINGLQFYGGIQTNVNGWENKESRTRVHRGHGAIFSRWSHDQKTPIGLEHVQTADPSCLVESAGYEGEFASVRRPIKWAKGTWTYEVRKAETDEQKNTWFECRIKSPDGTWTPVGKLRFEGDTFTFSKNLSAFVEVYSTAKIRRSNIPKVNVTFGWPQINGKPAKVKKSTAFYPNKPPQASPDCANISAQGENTLVEVGAIFKRDPKTRSHKLEHTAPKAE
ncbi:hypothetical protein Rhal01_02214 [Rubritalea halochordaticola]|uniref:Uncharacterized protein n=1 Tax=Rubritalea halochordaticola TaxID=714537 RepID=A0ABP9V0J9_9BACT